MEENGNTHNLIVGLIKTSLKSNERRIPVYPEHYIFLPENFATAWVFEASYGKDYRFTTGTLLAVALQIASRENSSRDHL